MTRFWESLPTLAGFGILFIFLPLLFVASAGGRSDGREIPFAGGVLQDPGCYVAGCHLASGGTLSEIGSVSFNKLPERFVPGETYDLGITITGGTAYGFQVATVFSDGTQAGALTAITEATIVDEVEGVQILTHTSRLEAGIVDFQWTAPINANERRVILKVASNSANRNGLSTGDAINTLDVSIPVDPVESTERLYFAQFANGDGLISQITLLTVGSEEEVHAQAGTAGRQWRSSECGSERGDDFGRNRGLQYCGRWWRGFHKRRQRAGSCRIFDCPCRRAAERRCRVRWRSSGCGRGRQ